MKKRNLLSPRVVYAPFEYPEFYELYERQQSAHWLVSEISFLSDINDWKTKLTEQEQFLIGSILKGFTQSEVFIGNDYWSNRVAKKFKIPEIQMMAICFANMETIHAVAYSTLQESLGIFDYDSFLHEPSAKAKIDRMIETPFKTKEDIAISLAVFSAFNEGVNLFSSFAVLLSFSRRNLLKGLGQVISFSVVDEATHSTAGCKLFRTLIEENPELWTDELKKQIYDAARLTIELEDQFLEKAFSMGDIEGLTLYDMKQFIRHRANIKLKELGLKSNWKNIDQNSLTSMAWFDVLTNSNISHQDFFAGRVSTYSKVTASQNWDNIWDNNDTKE